MPPIRKTSFQKFNVNIEFDPDDDWEEVPEDDTEPVYCCKCTEGNNTYCNGETGVGAFVSTAAAQTVAFWYG